jgi:hypothetical protein
MIGGAMEKAKKEDFDPLFVAEKAARLLLEENGADAVVILWTSQRKRQTRAWRHQIGNHMLCNAMVDNACESQNAAAEEEEEDD